MKNQIAGKHIYPNDGTDSRLKYCRNIPTQHFFQQCQIKNPIENPKNYKVNYSLFPFWVRWIDNVIEFFEKITGKEF